MHFNLCLIAVCCVGHICAKAVTPDIKQCLTFSHIKKRGKCLKSLQLKSYKSALAVVLQHNLCKAMALLSLNRFSVVGTNCPPLEMFFSVSVVHRLIILFPPMLEASGNLYIGRSNPFPGLSDCIIL